ncbi:Short chain dehydrogenase gsfE [Hyphodiscus hymeniophilus]|uniref:Short chain dehydrogenase gsfE n=1 Tax=Hyphodiscus hymeniophilus TaxID=353542 RepID=A0A9P7AVC5_9HELO|nr:Short chain dehydrogenase gsfE [Hyphodiscus hymeniophilus]
MPRTLQTTYSEGILYGLPTFPAHNSKKYTAIVTGSNGISGSEIVNALIASPERWETIYSMSRKPPKSDNRRVKPIAADFLNSTPAELAVLFKKESITADYVFFTSYLQPASPEGAGLWSNTDELDNTNVTLLSNFLSALSISQIVPKRFLLQTGGKHYGVHLGPTAMPMTEDTPALRVPHSNFYFPQEDLLTSWCLENNTHWTVTRPGFIIGANENAQINISYALALYAAIQRELKGRLEFPADLSAWDINKDLTYAGIIGYFSEWAVLTDGAADQALNIVDDSPFSYGKFWPKLAAWFGIPYSTPDVDPSAFTEVTMPRNPAPRGFGPAGKVYLKWTFSEWAKSPEVKKSWEILQEREGLRKDLNPWRRWEKIQEVWGALDAEILGGWGRTQTMDKSKKLGWLGHVQTDEGIKTTVERMVEMKMVPKALD